MNSNNELQQWACENDMKLNGLKCKEMVISFLRQSDNYTPLHINDQQLELVTSFKILGLTINNHLKWNDNVAIVVKKRRNAFTSFRCCVDLEFHPLTCSQSITP